MKNLIFSFLILCLFISVGCESEPITGNENVILIETVEFSVDSTYAFGDDFRAIGTITNNGTSTITPVWYLEGSFFRDDSRSFKFGGDNTSFNFSLAPNQSTGWQLSFKDSNYPASRFPDFVVGELRAYKNETNTD